VDINNNKGRSVNLFSSFLESKIQEFVVVQLLRRNLKLHEGDIDIDFNRANVSFLEKWKQLLGFGLPRVTSKLEKTIIIIYRDFSYY